jgi:3,2-trans-enoyl-CoA isomerase
MLTKLTLDIAPKVSLLQLCRPPVNALNTTLLNELSSQIRLVEEKRGKEGHGLVLSSSNDAIFTAGLDLDEMYNKSEHHVREFWQSVQNFFLTFYASSLATGVALQGTSPAGGCFIAICSDYRVGANDVPKARIGLNEAKFGLVAPEWFAVPLAACVGTRKAERMLQLGELLPFNDAHACGLIDELVPKTQVVEVTIKRMGELAKNGPPAARHESKLMLRKNILERLANNRTADLDWFAKKCLDAKMQQQLGAYLESLKKKG